MTTETKPHATGRRIDRLLFVYNADSGALNAVIDSGKPLRRTRSGGLVLPMLRMLPDIAPALDRAGRGAWADMWFVAPPLAALAFILKLFGVRSGGA